MDVDSSQYMKSIDSASFESSYSESSDEESEYEINVEAIDIPRMVLRKDFDEIWFLLWGSYISKKKLNDLDLWGNSALHLACKLF